MIYNRIAVVYRGHVRTWNFIKKANFKQFSAISKNVEYYFVTWNLPYNHNSIINDFKDQNLIKYLTVNTDKFYDQNAGPRWLNYNILPYKRLREKEVSYDLIVDIRPDVILANALPDNPFPDNTIKVQWIEEIDCVYKDFSVKKEIGIDDTFGIMTSKVYDVLSFRFLNNDTLNTHVNAKRFCDEEKILIDISKTFTPIIVRPNIFVSNIKSDFEIIDNNQNIEELNLLRKKWSKMPTEEKKIIIQSNNILLQDYFS